MTTTDLLRDIQKIKNYRGCILVISFKELEKNPSLFREVFIVSRIAGKKLYILIDGKPSQWATKIRDYLSENIDVSVYLYEIRNLDDLVKELRIICSKDKLLFVSANYAKKLASQENLFCGEKIIV
ncbi:MAG: hypothetical protein ACP5GI_03545 [Sulfolobales archaeon]